MVDKINPLTLSARPSVERMVHDLFGKTCKQGQRAASHPSSYQTHGHSPKCDRLMRAVEAVIRERERDVRAGCDCEDHEGGRVSMSCPLHNAPEDLQLRKGAEDDDPFEGLGAGGGGCRRLPRHKLSMCRG